jgi:pyochelin biosynthetic protein PchC
MSEINGAWIRRFHQAPGATAQVICFPHAGGSCTYYFPMSRALAPAIEVLAIQYPGRQDRHTEPCVDDLRMLADLVTPEIVPLTERPVLLFGHSMGATLAYEVALRLADAGVTPLALFVSGRRAPSTYRDERIHLYSKAEFIADIERLSGTDPRLFEDDQVVDMILPALRSDYRAAETYRYRESLPLACPVVALIGDSDPQVTVDEARAWDRHTTAGTSLRVYPGGHFFLAAHAGSVLNLIRDRIAGRPLTMASSE